MELVCSLKDKDNLLALSELNIDGIIIGSLFTSKYNYKLNEIKDTIDKAKALNIKTYISIDTMIHEDEIEELYMYLDALKKLEIDGIYFSDLAVIEACKSYDMESLLIYDGGPVLTNSLDVQAYLSMGIDSVVLARELTLDEVLDIIKNQKQKIDMQIFGHIRLSTSKRMFLTNYFKYLDKEYDVNDKDSLRIVEEKRDYKLPIKQTKFGTDIYSDYVFEVIEELPYLRKMIKRGIIDDSFLDFEVTKDIISAYHRCEEKNAYFVKKAFVTKHKDYTFDSGYLYQKTNILKDEE